VGEGEGGLQICLAVKIYIFVEMQSDTLLCDRAEWRRSTAVHVKARFCGGSFEEGVEFISALTRGRGGRLCKSRTFS
jgi:hypothetical protein